MYCLKRHLSLLLLITTVSISRSQISDNAYFAPLSSPPAASLPGWTVIDLGIYESSTGTVSGYRYIGSYDSEGTSSLNIMKGALSPLQPPNMPGQNGVNWSFNTDQLTAGYYAIGSAYILNQQGITNYIFYLQIKGPSEVWTPYNELRLDWHDTSGWTPDAANIPFGQAVVQTKNQQQDWERGERSNLGNVRNVETYTIPRSLTQLVTGSQLVWIPYDELRLDWYDASAWSPDPSTIASGQAFTQSKNQLQDWEKGERSSQGGSRNVQPYKKSRSLTQSAFGTQTLVQAVTLTPLTSTIQAGQSVTFTAAGGINGYVWTGGGTGNGPAQTIAFPKTGTFAITVFSPTGSGYAQSNTASATVVVVRPAKVTVQVESRVRKDGTNEENAPVHYIINVPETPATP